jgi:MFS transporter, FHS family, L-fucose permease
MACTDCITGTANLGRNTRRGAGILVMGVSGGAVFPPIQGAIADSAGTRISYVVPLVGFVVVLAYVTVHWMQRGFHVLRVKGESVIATSIEGGNVGGVMNTVHYDEKRLSVVSRDEIRRASVRILTSKKRSRGVTASVKSSDFP